MITIAIANPNVLRQHLVKIALQKLDDFGSLSYQAHISAGLRQA
jgi:hypothetical protein